MVLYRMRYIEIFFYSRLLDFSSPHMWNIAFCNLNVEIKNYQVLCLVRILLSTLSQYCHTHAIFTLYRSSYFKFDSLLLLAARNKAFCVCACTLCVFVLWADVHVPSEGFPMAVRFKWRTDVSSWRDNEENTGCQTQLIRTRKHTHNHKWKSAGFSLYHCKESMN